MKTLGHYEILDVLGDGGMGTVFKARDPRFDRIVALKVLHPQYQRDATVVERFKTEAVIQAKLAHPNIVNVYDFVLEGDQFAMVLEYVDGVTLDDFMRALAQTISPDRILGIFAQILDAIGYAHDQGLVHRDIKPSNILIESRGERDIVKVMDFGIAKILGTDKAKTKTGAKMGTLCYMSPEQIRSPKYVDTRSDIYSLGATLYEIVAGSPPFESETEFEIMTSILEQEPRYDFPREFGSLADIGTVLAKSMAKDPDQRFQSCGEFARALQGARVVPPPPPKPRPRPVTPPDPETIAIAERTAIEVTAKAKSRGTRIGLIIAALIVVIAAGIGGAIYLQTTRAAAAAQAELASAERQREEQLAALKREQEAERASLDNELAEKKRQAELEQQRREREEADRLARETAEEAARRQAAQARQEQRLADARTALQSALSRAERMRSGGDLQNARETLRTALSSTPSDLLVRLTSEETQIRTKLASIDDELIRRQAEQQASKLAQEAQLRAFQQQLSDARSLFSEGRFPETKSACERLLADPGAPADVRSGAESLKRQAEEQLRAVWEESTIGPGNQKKRVGGSG